MANNIFTGSNSCSARVDADFTDIGIMEVNTEIIYLIEGTILKSYKPGRGINAINGFVAGKGYYFISKVNRDLSEFLVPPIPITEDMTNNVWYDITGSEGSLITFDGTNGYPDLKGKTLLKLNLNNEELKPVDVLANNNEYTFDGDSGSIAFNITLQTSVEAPGHISILYR